MAQETEAIGVITKTHGDSCEISAIINGIEEVLPVERRRFYTFGIRCDGDMTNILEQGMEIKFCFSVAESKPTVTVAWLGDRPEVVEDDSKIENDGKGVITKVARNTCEMTASVNGNLESLSFHREIFFAFGIRCEGNLMNIVEVGMEVEFCYSVCESEIVITAVWLGEKPDLKVIDDFPVEAVYNEKGRICHILDTERFIVRSDHVRGTVLVHSRVVYRNGATDSVDLAIGDDVTFDAIPFEGENESGVKYEATCAWIGEVPRIVDRFSLNIPKDSGKSECDLKYFHDKYLYGTLAVIVNEFVAFVEVECDGRIELVMLFRSSFQRSYSCLQDAISTGDRILVLLGMGTIFKGCRQLYVVKAWRNDEEKNQFTAEEKTVKPEALSAPINVAKMGPSPKAAKNHCLPGRFNVTSKVLYPCLTGVIRPYEVKRGKKLKESKLASLGVIRSKDSMLSVLVRHVDFYVNGKACLKPEDFVSIVQSKSTVVNFEGVLNPYPEEEITKTAAANLSHLATCAWIGRRPSLKAVASRVSATLDSLPKNKKQRFAGSVTRFYLPDKAIGTIGKLNKTVCLHVTSFSSKPSASLITDYVKLGQRISFQVVSDPMCEIPMLAVNVKCHT